MVCFYILEVAQASVDPYVHRFATFSSALTLGGSIWSMHFIGMLALRICAPMSYDMTITAFSVLPGLLASYVALDLLLNKDMTPGRLMVCGVLLGTGISIMHYWGMQAMTTAPALRYHRGWFMSSIVVAIGLATLALWVAGSAAHKKLPVWSRIAISGSTLGAAVSLTHYIGMKAAVFVGYPSSPDPIAPEGIAPMVFAITLGVLVAAVNILGMNLFFKYRELARLNSQKNQEQQVLIRELQEAQQQLIQSEKMASVGQLASGIAHEINNPIGFVNSNISALQNYASALFSVITRYKQLFNQLDLSAEQCQYIINVDKEADLEYLKVDTDALLAESLDGLKRVKVIVQSLKDFAHVNAIEWQHSDIHQGIESTLNIVANEIKYKATIEKNYGSLPLVSCVISQLNQVFMNLFVNASHAIQDKGVITISTGVDAVREEPWVWIKIADTGSGIAPEHLKRIFDPFFTTKPIGTGTGLGLSLAYGIINKHQGQLEVDSEVGKGTSFTIRLPVSQKEKADVDGIV